MDILIPTLPTSAWRLLLEMLQCDTGFCHTVTPWFRPDGFVTVYISRKTLEALRGPWQMAIEGRGDA